MKYLLIILLVTITSCSSMHKVEPEDILHCENYKDCEACFLTSLADTLDCNENEHTKF